MTKKFYHVLVVMALCLTTIFFSPLQIHAKVGDTFSIGQLKYTVLTENGSIGTVSVEAESEETYGNIVIPESVEKGKYTYSVVILSDSAFLRCFSLNSVTIPNGVTSIGDCAFQECGSLTSVIIPNSVTFIGKWAFDNCMSLTRVTIPSGVISINDYTFYNCSSLTNIAIPNSVTSIGKFAFSGCNGLEQINIPDSVISIGDYAFYYCSNLRNFSIPAAVISIGNNAFSWCNSLNSITVSANNPCYISMNGVLLNKDQTELIQYPIGKKEMNYVIPNSVTSIGNNAFAGCGSLENITIPNGLTSIGEGAFHGCFNLPNIIIPDNVTSIENMHSWGVVSWSVLQFQIV